MTMPEAEAIPFEPQDLRGERLLVLAPHPDDEVIGCGGLVALHLRDGRKVHVVVATDGAQAGDAAQRESESRTALASLGDATPGLRATVRLPLTRKLGPGGRAAANPGRGGGGGWGRCWFVRRVAGVPVWRRLRGSAGLAGWC